MEKRELGAGHMADRTREYSLLGRDGEQAVRSGLAGARWYQTDIPRKQLAELMKRRRPLFSGRPGWLCPAFLPMAFSMDRRWIRDGMSVGTRRHSSPDG